MLKWTASAHKLNPDTPHEQTSATMKTPRLSEARRKRRRATIANKENIIPFTSTPMVARSRNSPLVLAPLSDILNVTPDSPVLMNTAERLRRVISTNVSTTATSTTVGPPNRRHSTIGFAIPTVPQYASTLPRFEEEYSPCSLLPTGQQLALRGLLPDPFMGNPRYFHTPELVRQQLKNIEEMSAMSHKSLPKKRKLEQEFTAIAEEDVKRVQGARANTTAVPSAKMGDQTLDNLIDAILDSARKEEKKKKPRKSFNLRRRTLLKNQVENVNELMLSPSYAAGDDPASDLSFLLAEPIACRKKSGDSVTPAPPVQHSRKPATRLPPTPEPATPSAGTAIPDAILMQMPTPTPALGFIEAAKRNESTTTFTLETPVRPLAQKRRKKPLSNEPETKCNATANVTKKFKVDTHKYFEIGLALPSIYV